MAALSVEVQEGDRVPVNRSTSLTVADLIDWYLSFARDVRGLERTTLWGYREVFETWLKPRIGSIPADRLTPTDIDFAFGEMRAAGKSHSRMNNARSALNGAYKWGRRHEKVRTNPMRGFEMPQSHHVPKPTVTPELDELRILLEQARDFDSELAPVLLLAATTGIRRGELSGLRRDRLSLDRSELHVERSISEIEGALEEKPTKTHRNRTVRLDQATVAFLQEHLAAMDAPSRSLRARRRQRRLRLLHRARLLGTNAARIVDTPDATAPQTPRHHQVRLRRQHSRHAKMDQY